MKKTLKSEPKSTVSRCAVYTRKSTEEGLEQAFNSLDAQREAGEAYIRSQAGLGWELLPDRYDDGGFSGGSTDRPALRRLLSDIDAGRVNVVVVYKVDRLSRSLPDFARLIQAFDTQQVSFVSVTQQFNTATSMGRLVLNVLLSFAQFEREIISERTRDKIAATRRKGLWSGGRPPLGYSVDSATRRLIPKEPEAESVRAAFTLYDTQGSLLKVVEALSVRGHTLHGRQLTRTGIYRVLTNVAYVGKVRYRDEVHSGNHEPLVAVDVWTRVQAGLVRNGRGGGVSERSESLLAGLLRCGPCGCGMTPTHTAKGTKRYRYYACTAGQKRGACTCPSGPVSAGAVEGLVVAQLAAIARDPKVVAAVTAAVRAQDEERAAEVETERRAAEREVRAAHAVLKATAGTIRPGDSGGLAQLADAHTRVAAAEAHCRSYAEMTPVTPLSEADVAAALSPFGAAWEVLPPRDRSRAVRLLIERIDYDGARDKVAVAFRATGIRMLAKTPETRS